MQKPDGYLKFIDPASDKKYVIYEYVRGTGDMSIYCRGRVIGKKTAFDTMNPMASTPITVLKNMIHNKWKCDSFATYDDLEADLFMESFLEY